MDKHQGVWIDHRRAVVVTLQMETPKLEEIASNVERHVRAAGGSRSSTHYGPQQVHAEDRVERKYARQLERYYDRVIGALADAGAIYVFGPGEAKRELVRQMEKTGDLSERVVAVDTADKLTDRQIVARVKKCFARWVG